MQSSTSDAAGSPSLCKALLLASATVAFLAVSLGALYLQAEPEAPATAAR